jgi:hypothetical protein
MLAHQLAERPIIQFVHDVAKFFLIGASFREHGAVMLAQRPDKSVAVLLTYLAVFCRDDACLVLAVSFALPLLSLNGRAP